MLGNRSSRGGQRAEQHLREVKSRTARRSSGGDAKQAEEGTDRVVGYGALERGQEGPRRDGYKDVKNESGRVVKHTS